MKAQTADVTTKAQTQWTPFTEDPKYFDKNFIINNGIENLEKLVEKLKKKA